MTGRRVRGELALAALALTLLGLLAYGQHLLSGGFYNDDWGVAAFAHHTSFGQHVDLVWSGLPHRPLYALYQPVLSALFGAEPSLHLGWALAVGVALVGLYAVLRSLAVPAWLAMASAALMLLFPWSDALRLWATAANGATAIALFLWGLALALAAFRRGSRLLHALSLATYLAAVLLYESVVGGIVGVIFVYLLVAPRRAALIRWACDLAALATVLAVFTSRSNFARAPLEDVMDNAWRFADQATTVLARAIFPFAGLPRVLVLGAALTVLVAGGIIASRAADADPIRRAMRLSIGLAAFGCLAIACGYALYAGANPDDYAPLFEGAQNRVNGFAGIGYALVVAGVWFAAASLVLRGLPDRAPELARYAAPGALVVVALAWALDVEDHRKDFEASWQRQQQILAAVEQAVPEPEPGTVILTFGHPMNEAYGVPVIGGPEDLKGALQLRYDEHALAGYGVFEDSTLTCSRSAAILEGYGFRPVTAPYARTFFVDTQTATALRVRSAAACKRAAASLPRGPAWQSEG